MLWWDKLYYFGTKDGVTKLKYNLDKLGILGIKFQQYLYSRTDIISDEARKVLLTSLDNNKPQSIVIPGEIRERYTVGKIIGCGSLAQTYEIFSKKGGEKLCLKLLIPNKSSELRQQIGWLVWFTKYLRTKYVDWDSFMKHILIQLNFRREAKYIGIYYETYKEYPLIMTPRLIEHSDNYIVMSYIKGEPLHKKISIYHHQLLTAFTIHSQKKLNLIHGDLHGGNVMINGKTIGIVDFGIVCETKKETKKTLYLFQKCMADPELENCRNLVKCMALDYVDQDYEDLHMLLTKLKTENRITNIVVGFQHMCGYLRKNNILLKGNCLYTFLSLIILEGVAEKEFDNNSHFLIKALSFMKKDYFFVSECGYYISQLYKFRVPFTPQSVLFKYN